MGIIFLAGVHHVLLPVLQLSGTHRPVARQMDAVLLVTLDKQSIRFRCRHCQQIFQTHSQIDCAEVVQIDALDVADLANQQAQINRRISTVPQQGVETSPAIHRCKLGVMDRDLISTVGTFSDSSL